MIVEIIIVFFVLLNVEQFLESWNRFIESVGWQNGGNCHDRRCGYEITIQALPENILYMLL